MNAAQFILAFLISTAVTALCSPAARRVALRWGLVDEPNPRRINRVPMPTGGGLAIFVGFAPLLWWGTFPLGRNPQRGIFHPGPWRCG